MEPDRPRSRLDRRQAFLLCVLALATPACGPSRASAPSPGEARASVVPGHGYVPQSNPAPLLEGEDPVAVLLAFTAEQLERARADPRFADAGRTPRHLLASLALAERDGDWLRFAAGLDVPSAAHLAWAACLLLPQLSRTAHARWIELCERRFGAKAELTRMARGAWGMRRQALSQAQVRLGAQAGFFTPEGVCMLRIHETQRGWRAAALTHDERELQPAQGLSSLLLDLAAWECALAECPPEGTPVDERALLARVQERLAGIEGRIASHPLGAGR